MTSRVIVGNARVSAPHLKLTRYESVSSFLLAVGGMLLVTVATLILVWLSGHGPQRVNNVIRIETLLDRGDEEGAIDETLSVESPEDPTEDPSLADVPSEETELLQMLADVVDSSDASTLLVRVQIDGDTNSTGKAGCRDGTGLPPLGPGPTDDVDRREQRWFVKYDTTGSLQAYARQLDFFAIELGAYFPEERRLVYLSDVSRARATVREKTKGVDERVYMNWKDGDRRKADLALFAQAGINAQDAVLLHFYPPEVEQLLASAERTYQNMPAARIRRTYFAVSPEGGGYVFRVTKQSLR